MVGKKDRGQLLGLHAAACVGTEESWVRLPSETAGRDDSRLGRLQASRDAQELAVEDLRALATLHEAPAAEVDAVLGFDRTVFIPSAALTLAEPEAVQSSDVHLSPRLATAPASLDGLVS